jgi:hypothetical protein
MDIPEQPQDSQEEEWQQPKTKRQKKRGKPMQLQFFTRSARPPSIPDSQGSELL